MTPLVVLGARGMLGREVVDALRQRYGNLENRELLAWGRAELDIRDERAVHQALGAAAPAVVINSAAYTNVDGCESDRDTAMAVNAAGAGHVARACAALNAFLVHISTDFVFDGLADRPYRPEDTAHPLSVYGQSKWEGEQAIRATACRHLIVRTSWLYGPHGRNFVNAILRQAEAGKPLRVVNDQVGRPTLARDLAKALVSLIERSAEGTVHFANSGSCSWFEFACEIVRQAGLHVLVEPISGKELGRPAQRPALSALDLGRYEELTGETPGAWQEALARYLEARASGFDRPTSAGGTPAE